jgi:hypothetical protein
MNSRTAGPLFFAVLAFLLFGGAYAMWPENFFSTQFSEMMIGMPLRVVASLILAAIGLEFLCALVIAVLSDS